MVEKFKKIFQAYNIDSTFFLYLKSEKAQIEAVKRNGYAIRFIPNPSPEVQIEAVKRNGCAIQYITNPSLEAQIEAVKQWRCYSIYTESKS